MTLSGTDPTSLVDVLLPTASMVLYCDREHLGPPVPFEGEDLNMP